MIAALLIGLALADASPVARVQATAEPCHPLLDAWLREQGATPRGAGGRRTTTSTASGGPDGTWVTVHHGVAGAGQVTLALDGRSMPARVVAVAPAADLALLQVEVEAMPPPARPPRVGEPVVATGFPGDATLERIDGTVATTLPMRLPGRPPLVLQRVDLAVRRGLSGAPVLAGGEGSAPRVGIVLAGTTAEAGLDEDGLFLPEPDLSAHLDRLRRLDRNLRVGIRGVPVAGGVEITEVHHGGPAARAGLQPGDRIAAVGVTPVPTLAALSEAIAGGEATWTVLGPDGPRQVIVRPTTPARRPAAATSPG